MLRSVSRQEQCNRRFGSWRSGKSLIGRTQHNAVELSSAALCCVLYLSLIWLECYRSTFSPTFQGNVCLFQRDGRIYALTHVIDRQGGNRGSCECLDIYAGLVVCAGTCLNSNNPLGTVECKLKIDMRHGQWMAQRDDLWCLLSRHNASDFGDFQDTALRDLVCFNQVYGRGLHTDACFGNGFTHGFWSVGDIYHVDVAAFVAVGAVSGDVGCICHSVCSLYVS